MKFLKKCASSSSSWPQLINQLVILLVCATSTVQCHAIAEAPLSEPAGQNSQRLYPHKLALGGIKWLASGERTPSNAAPRTQLELPPIGAADQARQQVGSISLAVDTPATSEHRVSGATPSSAESPPPLPMSHQQVSSSANAARPNSPTTGGLHEMNRWIEDILINVEVMNLFNERLREQLRASEANRTGEEQVREPSAMEGLALGGAPTVVASEESAGAAPPFSQAPTDSGEDLLDSQLELTTSAGGNGELISSEERKLVESNNVSAIQAAAAAAAAGPQAQIVTASSKQAMSCEQAYTQCALREVCAPTLKAYNDECQTASNNQTGGEWCSGKCLRAMIALKSSEAGEDLANCDCQGNEFCLQSKARARACQPQVDEALEPARVVSCSVASAICMANQLCSTALGYYYSRCQSLFSLRHCSSRCNNSLAILHKQPQAMKLINCQCDGSEEFPCVKYKTYTEQLCLNKQTTSSLSTPTGAGAGQTDAAPAASLFDHFNFGDVGDAEDADEEQTAAPATNEDEGFNLTNEPADEAPATLIHGGARESDDYGGAAAAGAPSEADSQNANNYFFNGIQQPSIEDNWIPLVSGRYFTNLHQQQQRQQQQQQQRQKVKQQQRKPATRRAQKNAKQKVRPNEARRRHASRPYMFALTSSATTGSLQHSHDLKAALSALLSVILFTLL